MQAMLPAAARYFWIPYIFFALRAKKIQLSVKYRSAACGELVEPKAKS
jgi:hypothetical protein